MSSNPSVLKLCGEIGDELVGFSPVSSSSLLKFVQHPAAHQGPQLALLTSFSSFEYKVQCAVRKESLKDVPKESDSPEHSVNRAISRTDVTCSASQNASATQELPFTGFETENNSIFSFTLSLSPLLAASGLHSVHVKIRHRLVMSIAVWVDTAPSRLELPSQSDSSSSLSPSPATTPQSPQYAFQADGPQFRTFISHCENLIPTLRQSLKYTHERCAKVVDLINATIKEMSGLVSCAQDVARLSPSFPREFNTVTNALISTLKAKTESLKQLETALLKNLSVPLDNYISAIALKTLSARRKQYHDQAKIFYSYMGKNLSSADSTNLSKKIQFELERFDYFVYLTEYIEGSCARRFLYEIAQCSNVMEPVKFTPLVTQIKNYQSNLKLSKIRTNEIRKQILNSKSFSDFHSSAPVGPHRVYKEGILWAQKGHGKSSGWHKQWVVINGCTLSEYADWKTTGKKLSRAPLKLTFACIKKQNLGNFNGFEIITTDEVTRSFRVESESELEQWLKVLQEAAATGVQGPTKNTGQSGIEVTEIVSNSDTSNVLCCDCGSANQVEWVSINLLCVVCIKCSSVHRSLGAHNSKIRSLKLDTFTSKEILELMKSVSNKNVNSIYEAELHQKVLDPDSPPQLRSIFITEKYADRKYVTSLEEKDSEAIEKRLNHNLIKSIHLNSIYLLQQCIAQGVRLNEVHLEHDETMFQYSLKHYQGTKNDPIFFITEFLLLNGLQVGPIPHDTSSLSKREYDYWKSKVETNGVYRVRPIGRRATSRDAKKANIARIDTSVANTVSTRKISSASDASSNVVNKRWSFTGALPSSASASIIPSKSRGLKFPKISGGKNQS
ncbi:LAFA_0G00760g1_1 [Lachancea sp. 'fantastica']|nr:LAFA_0G00760g1_1 [Lachancea sp. 'fantastica']